MSQNLIANLITHVTAPELKAWLVDPTRPQPILLDVRENVEVERGHIAGIQHLPMREIPARIAELDDDRPIVCICHHGGRSLQVAQFLNAQGRTRISNLSGGVEAWSLQVDPSLPRY